MHVSALRPRRPKVFVICALILAAIARSSFAATVTVCPVGCDSTSIQGAVVAADPGDTVQILSSSAHTESDIYLNKDVAIAGFGISNTIVQGDATVGAATESVFVVVSGAQVTMQSLTIRRGGGFDGGGVRILEGDVTLDAVSVSEHEVSGNGGGVYVADGATLDVTGGEISSNKASRGGGIYNLGGAEFVNVNVASNRADLRGGGIFNGGSLDLRSTDISNNRVESWTSYPEGGGIYHTGTSLSIQDSLIVSNQIDGLSGGGGGLDLKGTGTTTITGTRFSSNKVHSGRGGGIRVRSGNLVIEDCIVISNDATWGGGLYLNSGPSESTRISHTVVAANNAAAGGGIWIESSGSTHLENSTVSGNDAPDDGGGVYVSGYSAGVHIASSTISDNMADSDSDGNGDGGGIFIWATATVGLRNTIIGDNSDGSTYPPNPVAPDCVGTFQSAGYNLVENLGSPLPACGFDGDTTGNLIGIDPALLPLADNGGPTQTHALGPGSPAIDAGNPVGCVDPDGAPLDVDQRHGIRQDRCDIGAFELDAELGLIFTDGFESGDVTGWSSSVP